jgi:uncharacterized protein (TIGR00251 family)
MALFLTSHPDGVILSLKVQPRASKNEIIGELGAELKIRVTAPPVDSAANEAVLEFLANRLGCPKRNLELTKGQTSRHKRVLIRGLSVTQVETLINSNGLSR